MEIRNVILILQKNVLDVNLMVLGNANVVI
jgi:hypothetical protein